MDLKRGSSHWFLNQNKNFLVVPHIVQYLGDRKPMTFHEIQKRAKLTHPNRQLIRTMKQCSVVSCRIYKKTAQMQAAYILEPHFYY